MKLEAVTRSCKECIYKECLLRTDKEFEICPVEVAKRDYEKREKND